MDENTNVQNIDEQEEVFDMSAENAPAVDEAAFEEEEEVFDMGGASATEMFEQQQLEELKQFSDIEGFAAKFSEKWVLCLPEDAKKVEAIVNTQLDMKKVRRS